MNLRPYQVEAVEKTDAAWADNRALVGIAATGLGKTVIFANVIARQTGRTMVIAHREELIFQAERSIRAITGIEPDIEMAEMRSAEGQLAGKSPVVISTVQTQTSGSNGGRMSRFDPDEFDLLVVDEVHHATAATYRRMIDHYRTNPNIKVLGVTATPDRADEEALGQLFDDVAWEYDIRFGISEGWLVPIVQNMVHVEGLDLSQVRTTAGDLNGADLARIMEYERNLHEIAAPTLDITKDGRKTLVFAASLAHAERLTEILNRHRPDSARWVHGGTPKLDRRKMLEDYGRRKFQYLVNVGVATEGFDDPGIEVVVQARPTKSRALYAQMIGRGTRPLPGIVDQQHDGLFVGQDRHAAITASRKPQLEVIDFVGNSGRHKLVTTADVLGGNHSEEVIALAKEKAATKPRNMMQALDEAEAALRAGREQALKAEAARRAKLTVQASYRKSVVNPFDVFGITPLRERGWDKEKQPSRKMLDVLERQGIATENLTFSQAKQLVGQVFARWTGHRCSYKQAKILAARGMATDMTRDEAKAAIDGIAAREGWGRKKQAGPTQYAY